VKPSRERLRDTDGMECLALLGQMILRVEEVVAWVAPLIGERQEGGALSGIETT
jgi:hypothetical protein